MKFKEDRMNRGLRVSIFATLLLVWVASGFAQDQLNEIRCSGGTACKAGFVPKFATNGGSSTVSDSIISQSGTTIKVAGSETVSAGLAAGGTISAGSFSGNGSGLTNVNAAFLNGLSSAAFARLAANNTFAGSNSFNGSIGVSGNLTVDGSGGAAIASALTVGGNFTANGTTNFFANPIRFTDDGVSGDLQQPLLVNAVDCCSFGDRMIWAHSPSFGLWGIYYDDSGSLGPADTMYWQQTTGTPLMSLEFDTGNLNVTGAITAGVKDFRIDHPLDPTNKYLYHSSIESSEMVNLYSGNAVLDGSGEAVVTLPDWFEAVNRDFRYQLTAIGGAAPGLHVSREISEHQFAIAGGASGLKVSWQVTGVRHDGYANAHPLVVEVEKTEKERGHYLHPEAFGEKRLTQEEMAQRNSAR
jgi:hypothetical protein